MRPVTHVKSGPQLSDHKKAKPALISHMGEYCAYCERQVDADGLHVEHIKPQKKHSKLGLTWSNFLLACGTCNTYKRHFQDVNRQVGILNKQAWPHLDNTFGAYTYDKNGRVAISASLTGPQKVMAQQTLTMAGLDRTPAVAASYKKRGLIYETIKRRERIWNVAEIALVAYEQNPTNTQRATVVNQAQDAGFFSVWMTIFTAHPVVKNDLISCLKATSACFDALGSPTFPRNIGRI